MISKAIEIIKKSSQPGKIVSRDTVIFRELMKLLDHPYKHFKSIHITGTNGKGSATIKLATALQNAGYKTGMYTSPHIFQFLQRIQVNNELIEQDYFAQTIIRLDQLRKKHNLELTFFQFMTATGFLYFKDQKCDFASIQVGLGGRYDTTNVITPEVSVITSIALDHQHILGNTRQKIASQKAGIIKPGVPVVVGSNANIDCIFQQANLKKSEIIKIPEQIYKDFDQQNNIIIRQALAVLRKKGYTIPQKAVQIGCKARQPCRMQILDSKYLPSWAKQKRLIFDVGHNPNGIQKIIQYYNVNLRKSKEQKITIIFGASRGKNVEQSLKLLQQFAQVIYLVQANHHRAMNINELTSYMGMANRPGKYRVFSNGSIDKTLEMALAQTRDDTILVCGSFFLMPQAFEYFKVISIDKSKSLSQDYEMKNI